MQALAASGHKGTVEKLDNYVDEHGRTPLMLAVLEGQLETVLHLALNGSDPSRTDRNGLTALGLAIDSSHREVPACPVWR